MFFSFDFRSCVLEKVCVRVRKYINVHGNITLTSTKFHKAAVLLEFILYKESNFWGKKRMSVFNIAGIFHRQMGQKRLNKKLLGLACGSNGVT